MTDYNALYQKFLNQTCSVEEAETLLNYFLTEQGDQEMVKLIEAALETRILAVPTAQDEESIRNNELRIMKAIRPKIPIWMLRHYISAAAAILIVVGACVWFFTIHNFNQAIVGSDGIARYQDLPPGKTGATLTLANGKNIRLADAVNGQLAQEEGITIIKNADGELIYQVASPVVSRNDRLGTKQDHNTSADNRLSNTLSYNTLSTAKGETYQVRLPDGSKVWLNAASSLSYPTTLVQNGQRRIRLKGEAYFEVSTSYTLVRGRRAKQPFIVESKGQEVEVLGTHFNISSYEDDGATKTTLLEGSVRVSGSFNSTMAKISSPSKERNVILKPLQQAVLTNNNQLSVKEADVNIAMAWKTGDFIFHQEPLENIMRQVARWYDVDVSYQTEVKDLKFDGMVSRSKNISSVLKTIALTGKVRFKVEGRKITVIDL